MLTMYGVSSPQLDQEACARLCRWTGEARFRLSEIRKPCEDENPEWVVRLMCCHLVGRERGVSVGLAVSINDAMPYMDMEAPMGKRSVRLAHVA